MNNTTDACGLAGQAEEGLRVLAEARAALYKGGELMAEAELYRLRGELLLVQNASNNAEAARCFRTAIEIGRRQSAKSLGLRAAINLARLLAKQGRYDEARTILAEIYGWFTEGFDTPDLRNAKALLDQLNT